MQINFTLEDDIYVAETQADNAAVVQLERTEPGFIRIFRRMVGTMGWTKYRVWGRQTARESFVADMDSSAYPCQWRIESETAVTTARMDVQASAATKNDIDALKERMDKVDGGSAGDTTDDIDTIQEMKAFLAGKKNTDTLDSAIEENYEKNLATTDDIQNMFK